MQNNVMRNEQMKRMERKIKKITNNFAGTITIRNQNRLFRWKFN